MIPIRLLFNTQPTFFSDFVLQCGGIIVGLKTSTESNRCDKLGIASLTASNTFATLTENKGWIQTGVSKRSGGTCWTAGGATLPNTFSLVFEWFFVATGGASTAGTNIASKVYAGTASGGVNYWHMFGGSDGSNNLNTIWRKTCTNNNTPAVISQTLSQQTFFLECHETSQYIFIAEGNTLSTTTINQTDLFCPDSKTNSQLYHSGFTNSAHSRGAGGNESRFLVVGGCDGGASTFYSTMEEVAVQSRTPVRSWGTLLDAIARIGMSGNQYRQIITNGQNGVVTATTRRMYINMESRGVVNQYDNAAAQLYAFGVDSGSN